MKSRKPTVQTLKAAASAALLFSLSALPSQAQSTVFWDANGGAGTGGTGTWAQPGSAFWNTLADGSGSLQTWTGGNYASFGGTAGVVTVSGTVNLGGTSSLTALSFTAGGYELAGGTLRMTPSTSNSAWGAINFSGGIGDVTIGSDFEFDTSIRPISSAFVNVTNATANKLTLDGAFKFTSSTGQGRSLSLGQTNATGSIVLNGGISRTGTDNIYLQIGNQAGSQSSASYYINGNNSGMTGGNSADLTKGIVYVGHASALGPNTVRLGNLSSNGDSVQLLTDGALTIANAISLTGDLGATRTLGGATAQNSTYSGNISFSNSNYALKLTAAAGGRVDISGLINDGTAIGGTLEKIGAGTVRLTRAAGNTYDGGTTVTAGTLLIMNTAGSSATGTAGVSVAGGATLGGTGFATGLVTASGAAGNSRFAPGNTDEIGTLYLTGGLAASDGATFDFHIDGASVDQIDFGSAGLTLDGDVTFNFVSLGTVQVGNPYSLFVGSGSWTGDELAGLNFVFNGPAGYTLDASYGGGDGYIWDAAGNSLTVQFAAVPEPATMGLLLLAAGALVIRRRRVAGVRR